MLTYTPGSTLAHSLDPRTKLFLQLCFAVPILLTTPIILPVVTLGVLAIVFSANLNLPDTIYTYRYAGVVLLIAPIIEGLTLQFPWFSLTDAIPPMIASYRIILLILLSTVYIHTTAPRESRAAIQRTIPGKPGQFLGVGVMIVFHIFPRIITAFTKRRAAMQARLSHTRPLTSQIELLTTNILLLVFQQSNHYSNALQSRCFAWNPTLPALRFDRNDLIAILTGLLVLIATILT